MATNPRQSDNETLSEAIAGELVNLQKALEATEQAISRKMVEMGMAPFTGPVLTAWREEVGKVIRLETKRVIEGLRKVIEIELARSEPALKIREAEEKLQRMQRQLEEMQNDRLEIITQASSRAEDKKTQALLEDLQQMVEELSNQLRSREEELKRLYNLTEGDPKYQAYHVLRDLSPNWVEMSHIGRSLGLPVVRIQRMLEEFAANGLIEIDGKRARTLQTIRKADRTPT